MKILLYRCARCLHLVAEDAECVLQLTRCPFPAPYSDPDDTHQCEGSLEFLGSVQLMQEEAK